MESVSDGYTYFSLAFIVFYIFYEWAKGALKDGKKNAKDWQMLAIAVSLIFGSFTLCMALIPNHLGALAWLEDEYFFSCIIGFVLIDELLHGWVHNFAHERTPSNLHGGADNRGELGVSQTIVVGWGWAITLPNYWFGYICLYLGLVEAWAIGTAIKSLWGIHTHANLDYDLKLLNHKNPLIAKTMYALCHVLTFPTQHHQHHSRSRNSACNMQNMLAVYDWLLWKKLAIEFERPKIYGWRKNDKEENNSLYRYFYRSFKKA